MSTVDMNPADLKSTELNPADVNNPVDLNIAQPGIEIEEGAHPQHGYSPNKDAYLRRLKRIEGQVRGIARMVEEDKYCIDILTQVSAVTRALQAVALGLVEDHLGHCVTQAIEAGGPDADAKVKEASEAIARLVRS